MQKHLAIGLGVKILDQKPRGGGGGFNEPPLPVLGLKIDFRKSLFSRGIKQLRVLALLFSSYVITRTWRHKLSVKRLH